MRLPPRPGVAVPDRFVVLRRREAVGDELRQRSVVAVLDRLEQVVENVDRQLEIERDGGGLVGRRPAPRAPALVVPAPCGADSSPRDSNVIGLFNGSPRGYSGPRPRTTNV